MTTRPFEFREHPLYAMWKAEREREERAAQAAKAAQEAAARDRQPSFDSFEHPYGSFDY